MKYEIIKGTINWKHIGEIIEMNEKLARAYWDKYLKSIKTEKKEVKNASNKALTPEDTETKWLEKNLSAL